MRGKLKDLMFGANGEQYLTVCIQEDFRQRFDNLKDIELDIEIKKHREKRSLDANAYFHVLCQKIAEKMGLTLEEIKVTLVEDYGTLARDEEGGKIGFKLPSNIDVKTIYKYTKCFDVREENGKLFSCYLVYKETHNMTTEEMGRLIDGTIYEAKQLGIETDTPEEIARFKALWREFEKENKGTGDNRTCQREGIGA